MDIRTNLIYNKSINCSNLINFPPQPLHSSTINNQKQHKIHTDPSNRKCPMKRIPTMSAPSNPTYPFTFGHLQGPHKILNYIHKWWWCPSCTPPSLFRCFSYKPRSARSPNAANFVLQLHLPWSCNQLDRPKLDVKNSKLTIWNFRKLYITHLCTKNSWDCTSICITFMI